MSPKPKTKKNDSVSSEELKTQILRVARKHFAQHGFNGASLKDIAAEAGIANSLINYHFGDKQGLFKAAIETFARDRMAAVIRMLDQPKSKDEMRVRLELFVDEMITSILADPHTFEIMDREMRAGNAAVLKIFQETMLLSFNAVVEFFKEAQSRGLLKEDVDAMVAASLLFTATCDSARKEHIAKKFFNLSFGNSEWRKKFAQQIVSLFTSGVMK